jgi:predicted dehydrogenase
MPQTVYATVEHLRPNVFPKVEDNATLVLGYPNAVGIFEGSWNLPRSLQDLEVFGRPDPGKKPGSVYMAHSGVELVQGREKKQLTLDPLPADEAEPVAYMVSRMRANKPIEGMTAMDINVDVIHIIDLAKESVKTGRAVSVK